MVSLGAISQKLEEISRWPFFAAFRLQNRVISALMMREAMTRYGRENIGFFWLMGEPLLLTGGIMIIWSLAGLTKGHNVDVIPFALTGYSVLTLWRHIVARSQNCFRDNSGLLFHRHIYFLDTMVARTMLETIGTGCAFFVAYVPLYLLGFLDPIADPLLLICAWLLLAWLSFGVGLILASLTEISHVAEHFVGPFLYLTLPITGSFFLVDWLPKKYQDLAVLSPLVGINEMFREGLWGNLVTMHWSLVPILAWCIGLTSFGLYLASKARSRIRFE